MSGILCWACLISAISFPQCALLQWRSEFNKNQEKSESQQNQDLWWIPSRDAAKGLLTCYFLLYQKAWGKPDTKVNLLWACKLRSTMERSSINPQKTQRKTATNTLWYGECVCFLHYKHLYSWRRITQTMSIPSKIQKISQWTDVWHIWKVDSRTIRRDVWSEYN